MIPEQLDLFGGPPKPPQKIREDELPATVVVESPAEPEVTSFDSIPTGFSGKDEQEIMEQASHEEVVEEVIEEAVAMNEWKEDAAVENEPASSTADPVSAVIAFMEPGDHEPKPVLPEPLIVPTDSVVIELPSNYQPKAAPEQVAAEPVVISKPAEAASVAPPAEPGGMQQFNIPPDEELFKRQYYSMRETATMFDITHSMLRYWENEFDILQPRKNRKGDRYFRPIDIKNLQLIYHLLKVRKFTLDGAREYLRNHSKALDTFELVQKLEKVKSFLHELKAHL